MPIKPLRYHIINSIYLINFKQLISYKNFNDLANYLFIKNSFRQIWALAILDLIYLNLIQFYFTEDIRDLYQLNNFINSNNKLFGIQNN